MKAFRLVWYVLYRFELVETANIAATRLTAVGFASNSTYKSFGVTKSCLNIRTTAQVSQRALAVVQNRTPFLEGNSATPENQVIRGPLLFRATSFAIYRANMATDAETAKTIYQFMVKDIDGQDISLEKFRGNVCLIVNVASK